MKKSNAMPSEAPSGLSAESQALYARLTRDYDFDAAAELVLRCGVLEPLDRMREAQRLIASQGQTIKDRFDQIKQHPAILTERDSRAALLKGLKALGLELADAITTPKR